jgi:hypothetical protein
MATALSEKEIYLLELYSSPEYFRTCRDTWGAMVKHVEHALDSFMHDLPLDYRNRPLPEQPDVVWGEQVLPNFRDTHNSLCEGLILLSNGDSRGLNRCNGPLNDFIGQREFWAGWMSSPDREKYSTLLRRATDIAQNISSTEKSYWNPGELVSSTHDGTSSTVRVPSMLPGYRLNRAVTIRSGEPIKITGIYLPDIDDSCAEFINTGYGNAPEAIAHIADKVLLHPTTNAAYGTKRIYKNIACTWTLVERDAGAPHSPSFALTQSVRVDGGNQCPKAGYYFSPAKANSRRWFKRDELMPILESEYGLTIWQYDDNQL